MSNVFIECASCGEMTHRESDWVVSAPIPCKPYELEKVVCPRCGSENIFKEVENTWDDQESMEVVP